MEKKHFQNRKGSLAMNLFQSNEFFTGCNYWASHAGMYMWRNWDAETVRKDLETLSGHGMTVLRVFPLWPDFQPLKRLYGGGGSRQGFGNDLLFSAEEERRGGVDPVMMERFRFLCDTAEACGLKLIVGLLTGWMSGRLFVPPAFEERNVLTDPEAVKWEIRFVRRFVREFREHPAIGAWDLGNECNCMGGVADSNEAWEWLNAISSAIRLEDSSHPVVSGMHSISTNSRDCWNLYDQGELLDVLTTHPYPLFTPECNREPFNTLRNELHSSGESLLYQGIAGKPCFPEEAGSLGPMICSIERAAASLRCSLFSCWANHLHGFLWWCAFDQMHLPFAPYDWTAVERELGLFHETRESKETARVMKEFSSFLKEFPYSLPERKIDAVCLVSRNRKSFPEAFGAYLLAKQAGFELQFSGAEEEIPEANFYLLPSVSDLMWQSRHAWLNLLEKVKNGATVMVSLHGSGMLSPFREVFGVQMDARWKEPNRVRFHLKDSPAQEMTASLDYRSLLIPENADVLAEDSNGNPMMTSAAYGKGHLILINLPLELVAVTESSGCFYGNNLNPYYLLYRKGAEIAGVRHNVFCPEPGIGVTEHPLDAEHTLALLINYDPEPTECRLSLTGSLERVWRGTFVNDRLQIGANDCAILLLNTSSCP